MRRGWLVLLAVAVLGAGCRPDAQERHDVSGEAVPARTPPMRPPEAHMEGEYMLVAVDGAGLPAVLSGEGDCRTEVVDASLRIDAGRFAFQNRVREVCGPGAAAEPVMHAAGGSVMLDGTSVVLSTDVGQAFSEVHGTADETGITLQRMVTEGGTVAVSWRFERGQAPLSR